MWVCGWEEREREDKGGPHKMWERGDGWTGWSEVWSDAEGAGLSVCVCVCVCVLCVCVDIFSYFPAKSLDWLFWTWKHTQLLFTGTHTHTHTHTHTLHAAMLTLCVSHTEVHHVSLKHCPLTQTWVNIWDNLPPAGSSPQITEPTHTNRLSSAASTTLGSFPECFTVFLFQKLHKKRNINLRSFRCCAEVLMH